MVSLEGIPHAVHPKTGTVAPYLSHQQDDKRTHSEMAEVIFTFTQEAQQLRLAAIASLIWPSKKTGQNLRRKGKLTKQAKKPSGPSGAGRMWSQTLTNRPLSRNKNHDSGFPFAHRFPFQAGFEGNQKHTTHGHPILAHIRA